MPNLFSSLREWIGFSQMIKSTPFNIFCALRLISSKLPIGVETMYKPIGNFSILFLFTFLLSCTPVNNDLTNNKTLESFKNEKEEVFSKKRTNKFSNLPVINEVEIILPKFVKKKITKNLINAFELSIYEKQINNLSIVINKYTNTNELDVLIKNKAKPGKIFIGTLSNEASTIVKNYCEEGILFFSFSSDKSLAGDCVYLINFFPEDDLNALFNFFPEDSKIALLYPENFYGFNISKIIDDIAVKSKSLVINKASYKEDLTNARESIKELGKYELRRYELERQKKILKSKNDEFSKKALNKILKFETLGNVDFTHIILPDYSIRLLEIAPLLPFYDVDPNKVQFVGTGVWDDKVFFDEPSLQGAIFSGIEERKRNKFFKKYEHIYNQKPIRTSTIPYDLVGIISYILNEEMKVYEAYNLLDSGDIKFDGLDGRFYFLNNIIFRELDILEINNGEAKKLN